MHLSYIDCVELTGSSSTVRTSSPYRFFKQGPQNWPLTPTQTPLRHTVLVSRVFCLHWWHELPFRKHTVRRWLSISSSMSPGWRQWCYSAAVMDVVKACSDSRSLCPRSCLCCGTLCCPGLLWWFHPLTSPHIGSFYTPGSYVSSVSHPRDPHPPVKLTHRYNIGGVKTTQWLVTNKNV